MPTFFDFTVFNADVASAKRERAAQRRRQKWERIKEEFAAKRAL